jgi:hypothetical protein
MVEDHDTEDSVEVLSAPPLPLLLLGMETVGADDEDERLVELLVIAPVSVLFWGTDKVEDHDVEEPVEVLVAPRFSRSVSVPFAGIEMVAKDEVSDGPVEVLVAPPSSTAVLVPFVGTEVVEDHDSDEAVEVPVWSSLWPLVSALLPGTEVVAKDEEPEVAVLVGHSVERLFVGVAVWPSPLVVSAGTVTVSDETERDEDELDSSEDS